MLDTRDNSSEILDKIKEDLIAVWINYLLLVFL